ncbi:hypothetical protein HPB52_025363 [Rhipicephalus sanguineus]|uniref:Uncharacterized protein n=1 Tax=Rhipicephalus sanguineus TaxID=34632 RepID=A0A9D4TCN7_RHISA|nr:hypothetical protein HPB52_025699 [Rhipicephalus sanguineus]KAH7985840.1 hypothetical protein HPB52_025363 [Rhipicephalus sanguineus]
MLLLGQMSYAIVEFTASKEVEIVPTTWVTGSVCVWPHNVKAEKAGKMAKKQHPPQSWWKQYEIAVKGLFDFQRHVLRLLNTLRFMLEQQADTLNKLCDMLPTSSVTECAELLGHPLSSLEELQEFDDKLDAGKFKILLTYGVTPVIIAPDRMED